MARVFSTSGPKYLIYSGAVVSSPPFSVSLWVYPLNTTEDHYVFGLTTAAGAHNYMIALYGAYTGLGTDVVAGITDDATPPASYAVATASFTANAWQHITMVWTSTSSRTVYLNGSNSATESTLTRTPVVNRTTVGAALYAGTAYGSSCRVAQCGLWNVALGADHVAALAAGYHPRLVRPASLVSCWDLGGFAGEYDNDWVGGYNLTPTNSPTWADGPPIIYPDDALSVIAATAAPATSAGFIIGGGCGASLIGA